LTRGEELHLPRVDLETGHRKPGLREGHGERQADIAQSYDADGRGTRPDSRSQRLWDGFWRPFKRGEGFLDHRLVFLMT
jgi:hypothetical protein